jgi:hypothetical protein
MTAIMMVQCDDNGSLRRAQFFANARASALIEAARALVVLVP